MLINYKIDKRRKVKQLGYMTEELNQL